MEPSYWRWGNMGNRRISQQKVSNLLLYLRHTLSIHLFVWTKQVISCYIWMRRQHGRCIALSVWKQQTKKVKHEKRRYLLTISGIVRANKLSRRAQTSPDSDRSYFVLVSRQFRSEKKCLRASVHPSNPIPAGDRIDRHRAAPRLDHRTRRRRHRRHGWVHLAGSWSFRWDPTMATCGKVAADRPV